MQRLHSVGVPREPAGGVVEAVVRLDRLFAGVGLPFDDEVPVELLMGNVAEIQNFLRIIKINLWSNLATRGRGVHLHTLVDRDAEELQERG